jgi:Ulp1 family protease
MDSSELHESFTVYSNYVYSNTAHNVYLPCVYSTVPCFWCTQVERFGVKNKKEIWQRRFLFVPINDCMHWSLAVICIGPPGARPTPATEQESASPTDEGDLSVVHMDTLKKGLTCARARTHKP